MGSQEDLIREIEELEKELEERKKALPAHSIRPHQLLIIEELEEQIEEKKRLVEKMRSAK
ncbi:MAG: histidine kinase [Deltaproteobacteria bacterium]|nr:MAG: histidine kinase [Deltaproteobacteria bacterium]